MNNCHFGYGQKLSSAVFWKCEYKIFINSAEGLCTIRHRVRPFLNSDDKKPPRHGFDMPRGLSPSYLYSVPNNRHFIDRHSAAFYSVDVILVDVVDLVVLGSEQFLAGKGVIECLLAAVLHGKDALADVI